MQVKKLATSQLRKLLFQSGLSANNFSFSCKLNSTKALGLVLKERVFETRKWPIGHLRVVLGKSKVFGTEVLFSAQINPISRELFCTRPHFEIEWGLDHENCLLNDKRIPGWIIKYSYLLYRQPLCFEGFS